MMTNEQLAEAEQCAINVMTTGPFAEPVREIRLHNGAMLKVGVIADTITALIAEVRRLRAENARAEQECNKQQPAINNNILPV